MGQPQARRRWPRAGHGKEGGKGPPAHPDVVGEHEGRAGDYGVVGHCGGRAGEATVAQRVVAELGEGEIADRTTSGGHAEGGDDFTARDDEDGDGAHG